MSRCFPFPPPGYLRNGSRSEALIEESIKLRMEMEKAEKDRKEKKERKREKKEKRREKKERKEIEKKAKASHASGDGKKLKHANESKEIQTDGKLQKGEDYENEQHERSGITEELDQPVTSLEHCCMSDSTQSSKRKRSSSQSSHDQGPAIRIRLPLRKHTEPEESKPECQSVASSRSAGIAASFTQNTGGSDHKLQSNTETSQFLGNPDSRHCNALPTLASGDNKATNSVRSDKRQSSESLYNSLLQIPPVTFDGYDLDEDWLFKSEKTEERPAKRAKTDAGVFQCAKSLWPRAQYMPEVDIYALPYTVPF